MTVTDPCRANDRYSDQTVVTIMMKSHCETQSAPAASVTRRFKFKLVIVIRLSVFSAFHVQFSRAFSESISIVNLSFCTISIIFDSLAFGTGCSLTCRPRLSAAAAPGTESHLQFSAARRSDGRRGPSVGFWWSRSLS